QSDISSPPLEGNLVIETHVVTEDHHVETGREGVGGVDGGDPSRRADEGQRRLAAPGGRAYRRRSGYALTEAPAPSRPTNQCLVESECGGCYCSVVVGFDRHDHVVGAGVRGDVEAH